MVIDTLRSKLVEFSKAGDTQRLGVLRFLLAGFKEKEIELRPQNISFTDEDAFKVIKKQIKQRNQSIELYEKGNRMDLADKERSEIVILKEFATLFPFDLNS